MTIANQDPEMAKRADAKHGGPAERLPVEEPGRGRDASAPSQIPPRGWRDILLRTWANIGRHRVLAIAAGITFYGILAIFPGIAAALAFYGFVADPGSAQALFDQLSGVLPSGGQEVLRDQITRIAAQPAGHLGFTLILGLLMSIWTASSGVRALIDALNIVYGEDEKRGLVKLYAFSIVATVAVIIFFLLVSSALIALPIALDYLGLASFSKFLLNLLRWPILFCIGVFGLAIIYRFGPSRHQARWRWISWGSVGAIIVWIAASLLFSWYTENFGKYNATYGSLGAIIGFMTWIWISAIVLLSGAEINAEMERQTVHDTTVGGDKPLGQRGAWVADAKGEAQE
ncbi:YihY/virulence factor BrkB family protein [Dongia soli]|uniref:YihY/virulence factor BrkB family protein n=1 Tax=Dongia soli TaxID=600628 RepID=A0ABU5EB75_9PROT|nr:YihY/virulence factor BrkB family protein [Dongia soli]MDY0883615.1 YihY/virulence factor BrkB family protein [Dongia soli]